MKAQVSLEYLSTYSWAIIILLAILSALNYFGFFNLNTLTESSCDLGVFLECKDVELLYNNSIDKGLVRFKFQNNMKDDIMLTRDINFYDIEASFTCNPDTWDGILIPRGTIWTSTPCTINNEFFEGDMERMSFEIFYKRASGGPEHVINGNFRTFVRIV